MPRLFLSRKIEDQKLRMETPGQVDKLSVPDQCRHEKCSRVVPQAWHQIFRENLQLLPNRMYS
jgi:hypothetical protein